MFCPAVGERIAHAMYVPDPGRDAVDFAGFEPYLAVRNEPFAFARGVVRLHPASY